MAVFSASAQVYTRGVGVYPGDPPEDFSPPLRTVEGGPERNLALHRPAYQSSAYDYNLTAQLITDGIVQTKSPRWIAVSTSEAGVLPKHEREVLFDNNWVTAVELHGRSAWIQVETAGGNGPPDVDRLDVEGSVQGIPEDNQEWAATLSGSDDGQAWSELGRTWGMAHPDGDLKASIALTTSARRRFWRVTFESGRQVVWHISELRFFAGGQRVRIGGPYDFTSAWMSAGSGEEWVYVDLGARCTFDRVVLNWIRPPAEGALQVSDDTATWKTIQPLSEEIRLAQPAQGRYVRVLMTKPATPGSYILSEMEVWGTGGPVAQPNASTPHAGQHEQSLDGGAWRLQRDSLVQAGGEAISQSGFDTIAWLPATVPATILSSYWNAGALPDPNFGDNQLLISDSFFHADFWYRREFTPALTGRHVWLNFDGVNWKAEVFLNGARIGRVDGGFMRGRFDISDHLRAGQTNVLAVRIEKDATPGSVKAEDVRKLRNQRRGARRR